MGSLTAFGAKAAASLITVSYLAMSCPMTKLSLLSKDRGQRYSHFRISHLAELCLNWLLLGGRKAKNTDVLNGYRLAAERGVKAKLTAALSTPIHNICMSEK